MAWYNPGILNVRGSRWIVYPLVLAIIAPLLWNTWLRLHPWHGFRVDNATVDIERIEGGGPGRDDIPALTDPAVLAADAADYLDDDDLVLGLERNGEARAYPIRILNWHEIVNDRLGGEAVVVTFCPLCGTGMVFSGIVQGERLDFGVSGLLYRDNLLMYDRGTESLWSQLMGEAVSGPLAGAQLHRLPVEHRTWREWRDRYPETTVLSIRTGHRRDYEEDPYRAYSASPFTLGGHEMLGPLPAKAWVIGVRIADQARAYPFASLALQAPSGILHDELAGQTIRVEYNAIERTAMVQDANGEVLPGTLAFWFAWYDFHPETNIWTATGSSQPPG